MFGEADKDRCFGRAGAASDRRSTRGVARARPSKARRDLRLRDCRRALPFGVEPGAGRGSRKDGRRRDRAPRSTGPPPSRARGACPRGGPPAPRAAGRSGPLRSRSSASRSVARLDRFRGRGAAFRTQTCRDAAGPARRSVGRDDGRGPCGVLRSFPLRARVLPALAALAGSAIGRSFDADVAAGRSFDTEGRVAG